MYQLLSSSVLFFTVLLGASANFLREDIDFQQPGISIHVKNRKNDNFLEPPYCGVVKDSKAPNRIYGGTEVKSGEFPWMVSFSLGCGGTLINSRWVLTAAHCFENENSDCVTAYLGTVNCENLFSFNDFVVRVCDPEAEKFEIEKVFVHEKYVTASEGNDIALVKLKKAVTFSDVIQPICLPYNDQAVDSNIVGKDAIVSGWGRTEYGHSKYLLKTTVEIWNADKCESYGEYFKENHITGLPEKVNLTREHQACAGGVKGIDTCGGDSGGPLFLPLHSSEDDNNEHFYQVGITSFGSKGCGFENFPGVYTNVSTYIPWIRETILENE